VEVGCGSGVVVVGLARLLQLNGVGDVSFQ
jgi:hypothetical protein